MVARNQHVFTSIVRHRRLWIALADTNLGTCELLCGEGDQPELPDLLLVEEFLNNPADYLARIRSSVFKIPWLWRPIRSNRISGKQEGMFFADEHTAFRKRRSEIKFTPEDAARLQQELRD